MPLKGVPAIISPDLLYVLSSMGHGDEIVLADMHFPTSSICKANQAKEVRADGHDIPTLLEAILKLIPLDQYVDKPTPVTSGDICLLSYYDTAALMDLVPDDKQKGLKTPVWDKYKTLANAAEGKQMNFELVERFAFYERAKKAFAVVHTGETAQYGNIILKKGVVL